MKILLTLLTCCCFYMNAICQPDHAVQLANHIAKKMKDSLSLTGSQRNSVFDINMQLNHKKQQARQQHKGSELLTAEIQKIENNRDSLYRKILPADKFLLYKQKKRNLISNN